MADPTAQQTREATANRVFLRKQKSRIWASTFPLLQILLTMNLSKQKETNFGLMTKAKETVLVAETWHWPVEVLALPNGGSYARGASYTFENKDQDVDASQQPFLYNQPIEFPASDIDLFAEATADSTNAINIMTNKKMSAAHQLGTLIADGLAATSTAGTDITALNEAIDQAGGVNNITTANQPLWASQDFDVSGPLSIRRMRTDIGAFNRSKRGKISLTISGEAVGNSLQDDVEARNIPMVDIVELFGKDPGSGENRLYLEQTIEAWKTAGAIHLIDPTFDANLSSTVIGIDMDRISLIAAKRNNFSIVGPENVELSDSKDAIRQLLKTAIFLAVWDRRMIKWENVTA